MKSTPLARAAAELFAWGPMTSVSCEPTILRLPEASSLLDWPTPVFLADENRERKEQPLRNQQRIGVGGGIRTLDSRSHSPEFYH